MLRHIIDATFFSFKEDNIISRCNFLHIFIFFQKNLNTKSMELIIMNLRLSLRLVMVGMGDLIIEHAFASVIKIGDGGNG